METFFTNVVLPLGVYLIPVSLGLMLLGLLWGMASNPRGAVKSLAGMAVMALIFIIAYQTADPTNYSSIPATASTVKAVQAGLTTFVVLLVVTLLAMIGSGVRNLIK
jgi:hypothetical protein